MRNINSRILPATIVTLTLSFTIGYFSNNRITPQMLQVLNQNAVQTPSVAGFLPEFKSSN